MLLHHPRLMSIWCVLAGLVMWHCCVVLVVVGCAGVIGGGSSHKGQTAFVAR
jgi:hypothetical protein